jgi:hypothetical protein
MFRTPSGPTAQRSGREARSRPVVEFDLESSFEFGLELLFGHWHLLS